MFKNPGSAISIVLNSLKFANKFFFMISAIFKGDVLLNFAKTIDTLHDISAF